MGDKPPVLRYEDRPPRSSRWPWVVIGIIAAVASCTIYASYFAGFMSLETMEKCVCIVAVVSIGLATVVAGVKYGAQKKDYWT